VPETPTTPFPLVDIVGCSMSWTSVDVGKCTSCGLTNGHHKVDVHEVVGKKMTLSGHQEEDIAERSTTTRK
jgi:hypothetical protein